MSEVSRFYVKLELRANMQFVSYLWFFARLCQDYSFFISTKILLLINIYLEPQFHGFIIYRVSTTRTLHKLYITICWILPDTVQVQDIAKNPFFNFCWVLSKNVLNQWSMHNAYMHSNITKYTIQRNYSCLVLISPDFLITNIFKISCDNICVART